MNFERFPTSNRIGNFIAQSPITRRQGAQMVLRSAIAGQTSQATAAERQSSAFACISGGLDHVEAPNLQTGK
jgi:hypothetical protein